MAETLPFTFTGADLYALCSDAMLKAVTRSARLVDGRVSAINQERLAHGQNSISIANFFDHHATDTDTEISVTEDDFTNAKQELVPSVSVDELRHYERVRNSFEGVTKKPESEKDKARPSAMDHIADGDSSQHKVIDFAKRANGSKHMEPSINGGERFQYTTKQAGGGASDADDDYVVRTDKLSLNNASAKPPSSKDKGKGKIRETPSTDGTARADTSEDLYD